MDKHSIQGIVEILLVVSCYRIPDTFQPDGSLGSYADFTFYFSQHFQGSLAVSLATSDVKEKTI